MKINTFEELKIAVEVLNNLLSNAQPGNVSWALAYGDMMTAIVEYWKNN